MWKNLSEQWLNSYTPLDGVLLYIMDRRCCECYLVYSSVIHFKHDLAQGKMLLATYGKWTKSIVHYPFEQVLTHTHLRSRCEFMQLANHIICIFSLQLSLHAVYRVDQVEFWPNMVRFVRILILCIFLILKIH